MLATELSCWLVRASSKHNRVDQTPSSDRQPKRGRSGGRQLGDRFQVRVDRVERRSQRCPADTHTVESRDHHQEPLMHFLKKGWLLSFGLLRSETPFNLPPTINIVSRTSSAESRRGGNRQSNRLSLSTFAAFSFQADDCR